MYPTRWHVVPTALLAVFLWMTPAKAADNVVSREDLREQLKERDAAIIELQHTVRSLLERLDSIERSLNVGQSEGVVPAKPQTVPAPQSPSDEAAPAVPSSQSQRLAVDKEATERALERTLVEEGALLLSPGMVQLQPSFSYSFNEFDFPIVLTGPPALLGTTSIERETFEADLALRVGLPFDSQLELSLPYRWIDQDNEIKVAGVPTADSSRKGNGFGDFSVGLAKTLVREGEWWPDIVLRGTWDTGTGSTSDNGIFLGGGFDALTGSVSFVKRRDPLAFFGSAGYQFIFENDDFDPGNQVFFQLGTALAVSPDSSLIVSINNQFFSDSEMNGQNIDGSDLTAVTLNLGASTIVSKGVLLSLNTGIGVTEDAPDYSIGLSSSVNFDLLSQFFASK